MLLEQICPKNRYSIARKRRKQSEEETKEASHQIAEVVDARKSPRGADKRSTATVDQGLLRTSEQITTRLSIRVVYTYFFRISLVSKCKRNSTG